MKLSLPLLAIALAAGLPLAACAQQSNAAENGPTPAMRAQMQQARDSAKTAAFNDLSPADRAKVQAIVDQVNNGQLTDLRAAAQQIDAVLTPAEAKAVLGERDKMMQNMRANMRARPEGATMPARPDGANMPARPDGAAPNAPGAPGPNGAAGGRHRGFGHGMNDAGSFLLRMSVSREKMRAIHEAQHPQGQPQ